MITVRIKYNLFFPILLRAEKGKRELINVSEQLSSYKVTIVSFSNDLCNVLLNVCTEKRPLEMMFVCAVQA